MSAKSERYAYRDLKICTKDCLCLFVCPTGATDNETGQIDFDKCIGCGAVIRELFRLADSKIEQIKTLKYLMNRASNDDEKRLYKALIHSNKVMVEDLFREAGYMLPQSSNTNKLLISLKGKDEEVDKIIDKLLDKLEVND